MNIPQNLNSDWTFSSRLAEREEIIDMPFDSFLDRPGHNQEPFLNEEMTLFYLPKNHDVFSLLQEFTKNVGCLKQETRALLLHQNTILGIGSNAGKKLDHCPRVLNQCKTGEGYEHCRDKDGCNQIEHAEIMAIHDALQKKASSLGSILMRHIESINDIIQKKESPEKLSDAYAHRNTFLRTVNESFDPEMTGLSLVLDGHWWMCQSCTSALQDAGVTRVYLKEDASILYNPEHPENILPRFNPDGTIQKQNTNS